MNNYGKIAQENWKTLAPKEYEQISNPEEHFAQIGETAMQQVLQLQDELAGPDQMDEGYLEKVGRLQAAKNQAEEIVKKETLTPPRDTWEPTQEDENPDDETFQAIRQMNQAARELENELD